MSMIFENFRKKNAKARLFPKKKKTTTTTTTTTTYFFFFRARGFPKRERERERERESRFRPPLVKFYVCFSRVRRAKFKSSREKRERSGDLVL